jgi:transcriptional regulator with PAS, ATPase and Fis domain
VLDSIENLLTLAESASLFGQELFELLHEQRVTKALALAINEPGKRVDVLECEGWDRAKALTKARNPGSCAVIDLGQWRGATYHLIVEPKDDVSSRITLASIRKIVDAALQLERYRREEKERAALWPVEDLTDDTDGVFVSTEMLDIVNTAKRVAPTTLPVLLTGETGTGKEILARVIHKASPRADKIFSAFNCTAVPHDMLDSQLFGYRRGAFTGAQDGFVGVIRGAAGGTLFLDEIAEIGLDLQPKLLRFLETGEIHPLGEAHPVKVDVRIIAATNANLDRMVGEGRFREDLLYRLNVIRFRIPPLRERREEIPQLVQHFLRRHADEFKKGRPRATDETMEYLLLFVWPGNVRQLANELRRIVALIEPDGEITPAHLSTEIRASRRTVPVEERRATDEVVVRLDQPLATVLDSIERLMVGRALEQAGGKVENAAARLGISRKGLFLKRKRWGMQPGREG